MNGKREILTLLRSAGQLGVHTSALKNRTENWKSTVASLREDGHVIVRDRIDGEVFYTLTHDAFVCKRKGCEERMVKPAKDRMCGWCREEKKLGLRPWQLTKTIEQEAFPVPDGGYR